jgi:hypothetical protein
VFVCADVCACVRVRVCACVCVCVACVVGCLQSLASRFGGAPRVQSDVYVAGIEGYVVVVTCVKRIEYRHAV